MAITFNFETFYKILMSVVTSKGGGKGEEELWIASYSSAASFVLCPDIVKLLKLFLESGGK